MLLKWAGGKARLADRIVEKLGAVPWDMYFEPFLGGGAVYFTLRRQGLAEHAILSDTNPYLIEFYAMVRDDPRGVNDHLLRLPREGWEAAYYDVRAAYNAGDDKQPQAARFLWLNRACFNGLYRENRSGQFNVPVGRYKRLSLPDYQTILEYSRLLQGATIVVADFNQQLGLSGKNDRVYCDPPYVPLGASFNYTAAGFGAGDQRRLELGIRLAADRGARVVASNHDTPWVRELYSDPRYHLDEARVRRVISASNRDAAAELIITIGGTA